MPSVPDVRSASFPSLPRGWSEIQSSCPPSDLRSPFVFRTCGPSHTGSQSVFLERRPVAWIRGCPPPWTQGWGTGQGQQRGGRPGGCVEQRTAPERPERGREQGRCEARSRETGKGSWTLTEGSPCGQWALVLLHPFLCWRPLSPPGGTPDSGLRRSISLCAPQTRKGLRGVTAGSPEPCADRGALQPWEGLAEVCWRREGSREGVATEGGLPAPWRCGCWACWGRAPTPGGVRWCSPWATGTRALRVVETGACVPREGRFAQRGREEQGCRATSLLGPCLGRAA